MPPRNSAAPFSRKMMSERPWSVYVLMCFNGRIYIGMALDVEQRFRQHVAGRGALFTRINKPYCIMAAKEFSSRKEAAREERAMKRAGQTWVRVWCRANQYHGQSAMEAITTHDEALQQNPLHQLP
jgi:putative endonuclease